MSLLSLMSLQHCQLLLTSDFPGRRLVHRSRIREGGSLGEGGWLLTSDSCLFSGLCVDLSFGHLGGADDVLDQAFFVFGVTCGDVIFEPLFKGA
jgi:hypothetical protein